MTLRSDLAADIRAQLDPTAKATFGALAHVVLASASFALIARHRLRVYCSKRRFLKPFATLLGFANLFLNASDLAPSASIGPGLRLPHPVGIVVGRGSRIGANVTIYHHVTLGTKRPDVAAYPTIHDNVTIFPGAVIAGNITIGENAVIGPNVVVLKDVPAGATLLPPVPTIKVS